MAGNDKAPIIVIKRKSGGHAAAHGGAWKVAYADFVTAMMCFFLVMWLMGADEETRSAVEEYFNNPTSQFKNETPNNEADAIGGNSGDGESILSGKDGQLPDQMVRVPAVPLYDKVQEVPKVDNSLEAIANFANDPDIAIETFNFTIPESLVFKAGTDEIKAEAKDRIKAIGRLLKTHKGRVKIEGFKTPAPSNIETTQAAYEFAMTRVVSLMAYLVYNKYVDEKRVQPQILDATRFPAAGGKERYIHFRLEPSP